jgi:ABC-type sugar transport system substrate-binding protein
MVAVNLNSPSITRIKDAFVKAAEEKGWQVDVFDGKGDQAATNNQAMQYLRQGYDAIVNNSSPNQQMTGVIKAAHDQGKKFISIYGGAGSGVDVEIGTNEFINSSAITQAMVDRLGGKGNVLKLNWTVLQALRDRDHAFDAVMEDQKGIKVVKEIEVKVPGQVEDALNQTTNFLKGNKNVDAIWIGWDELSTPVVRALEQSGVSDKTFVVGFNGNPFAWDLIRSKSAYVMEPANPFEPMGTQAVQATEDLVGGKPAPEGNVVYMRPCMITPQTVPAKGEFPEWDNCPYFSGDVAAAAEAEGQ